MSSMRIGLAFVLSLVAFFSCHHRPEGWTRFRRPDIRNCEWRINEMAVQCIAGTRDGLWFGLPKGLVRYQRRVWSGYSKEDGIPGRIVWSLRVQGDSLLWIAAEDGIAVFRNGAILSDSAANLLLRDACAVLPDRERIYVGTARGIYSARVRFADKGIQLDSLGQLRDPGFPSETLSVSNLDMDSETGDLWAGTYGGVVRVTPNGKWSRWSKTERLPDNIVYDILWDQNERCLWAATAAGLARLGSDGAIGPVFDERSGLASSVVTCLGKRGNRIWAGTLKGAGLIDPAAGQVKCFFEKDGLTNDAVRSLYVGVDDVWFGCLLGGIARFQGDF